MTETEREKRDQETHDAVIEMRAVVMGVNGRGGLMQEISEVTMVVREMKLKCRDEEINVTNLLQDVARVGPRLSALEGEMSGIADFCHNNRKLIMWIGGATGVVALGIAGAVLKHVGIF